MRPYLGARIQRPAPPVGERGALGQDLQREQRAASQARRRRPLSRTIARSTEPAARGAPRRQRFPGVAPAALGPAPRSRRDGAVPPPRLPRRIHRAATRPPSVSVGSVGLL